jgi:hypothetical protein
VHIRQAPASVHHAIWWELDHVYVSAARNQQRVDGTDDNSQVWWGISIVTPKEAVDDERKFTLVPRRRKPAYKATHAHIVAVASGCSQDRTQKDCHKKPRVPSSATTHNFQHDSAPHTLCVHQTVSMHACWNDDTLLSAMCGSKVLMLVSICAVHWHNLWAAADTRRHAHTRRH